MGILAVIGIILIVAAFVGFVPLVFGIIVGIILIVIDGGVYIRRRY